MFYFFLIFFVYDILVYSTSLSEHMTHLRSKCKFAYNEVEYLRHVIIGDGAHTDPKKIVAMQQWPTLTDIKSLRGFLGLTGYYKKFIKGYG